MDNRTTTASESTASTLPVQSTSVDVAEASSHGGDPSSARLTSMTTQPLPLPPPPPPSSTFPSSPTPISSFPPLPPPPVEHLPVLLPPRYMHPDVRWRFGTLHSSAGFPRPFHPPLPIPSAPHPFSFPPEFVPVTQHTQTPRSGTVPDQTKSQAGKNLPTSSPAVILPVSETVSAMSSSRPIIRDFKAKGASPRFVPRQVSAARSANKIPRIPDPVVEELKQNAFVLGSKVQGPSLPSETERKRKQFQASETGNESLDKTVRAVRQKVSRVTADIEFLGGMASCSASYRPCAYTFLRSVVCLSHSCPCSNHRCNKR